MTETHRDLCKVGCGIVHGAPCEAPVNGQKCVRAFCHPGECESPENARITRGTPIEKLSLEIVGTEYEQIEKINEIIDRINAMNEVSR